MRGPPLHLGVILPSYGEALDAERLADAAVAAEQAGFDSGWVTDHLIVPSEHADIYGTIAEALVSLGFLAARTHRLELGAGCNGLVVNLDRESTGLEERLQRFAQEIAPLLPSRG